MTKITRSLPLEITRFQSLIAVFLPVLFTCIAAKQAVGWQDSKPSDDSNVEQIESALATQAKHWNDRNMEGFMGTYWKSDQLTFSGGGKTTRGWQATLDRYRKKYPPEKMGELSFDHQEVTMLGPASAMVLGQWHLDLDSETADGNFTLVLRKIDGDWKIIHDHSSVLPKE